MILPASPRPPKGCISSACVTNESCRQRDESRATGHGEFAKDRVEMLFHCLQTQASVFSDLFVAVSFEKNKASVRATHRGFCFVLIIFSNRCRSRLARERAPFLA